jgi:hypothetical protein
MSRRGLLGITALALLLGGCGGDDRQWTSDQLKVAATSYLAALHKGHSFSVTCPKGKSLRSGGKVLCQVRHMGGLEAVVITTDSSNHLHIESSFHL